MLANANLDMYAVLLLAGLTQTELWTDHTKPNCRCRIIARMF